MVNYSITRKTIENALDRLEAWVENHNYLAYEPSDGLTSPLRRFTFGNLFAERILQQVGRQSPINLRPILGIRPLESTKGRGYMAWGYLDRYALGKAEQYKTKAFDCLDWLDTNRSPGFEHHSWGNHYPSSSRSGRIAAHEPLLVWTSLIGQAFLSAYREFQNSHHLDIIESISNWILSLPFESTDSGICLSYIPGRQSSIHNSNMLGAGFLAQASKCLKISGRMREVADAAMAYSCIRQRADGSWLYGESAILHWVDSFHTAYNLDSLKRYIEATGNTSYNDNLSRGFSYFKSHFFGSNGTPKYYHDRTYPIDIQCASQAIETLTFFSDHDPDALNLACKVAEWTIRHMQDATGYFCYRVYPLGVTARIPMMHWGQATAYRAMAQLATRLAL